MAVIAETCVHSDEDINMYMEVALEPQDRTAAHGKVFYLEEKHDLCILRNYNVVARPFRPAIPKGVIMDDVHSLFNNKELSDLTILVEGKPIYCNRAMLAERCPVFKAMLYGPMKEGHQKTIEIPEARHEVFLQLIGTPSFPFRACVRACVRAWLVVFASSDPQSDDRVPVHGRHSF
jgi:hypothetical protein